MNHISLSPLVLNTLFQSGLVASAYNLISLGDEQEDHKFVPSFTNLQKHCFKIKFQEIKSVVQHEGPQIKLKY